MVKPAKKQPRAKAPRGRSVTPRAQLAWRDALKAALAEFEMSDGRKVTRLRAVADACVAAAMAGNVAAIKEIGSQMAEGAGAEEGQRSVRIVHTFKSGI